MISLFTRSTREETSAFSVRPDSAFLQHRGAASSSQLHTQHPLPHFASQHRAKVGECHLWKRRVEPQELLPCLRAFGSSATQQHFCNMTPFSFILVTVQAEDTAPPRPPLPRLYDYEETPPVVPPLPKEASVIRHTSVRGLKRQSDERKRDRESVQYVVNGDCKVCRHLVPERNSIFLLRSLLKQCNDSFCDFYIKSPF